MHTLEGNFNKGRPWELLAQFLKALPLQFTERKGAVTRYRENVMILFAIIVVRMDIRNIYVMRLLNTWTGGISQRSLEKISMSLYQLLLQGHRISTQEGKSQPIANVVHLGISGKVDIYFVTTKNTTWIIDT